MGEWFGIIGLVALAVFCFFVGLFVSRLGKRWWVGGYFVPLAFLLLIGFLRNFPRYGFVAGFGWLVKGRMECVVLGMAVPMLIGVLLLHVPGKRLKVLLCVLLGISSIDLYVAPFVVPIFARGKVAKLTTCIENDVCIQTTDYTCGPASAVTALRMLGVKGHESDIGVAAYTCPRWGTPDDLLADAVVNLYGNKGVTCKLRYFKTIEEMKDICPVIAEVKFGFMVDHYVTVLKVEEDEIVVGDPLYGRKVLTHEAFLKKWRMTGIVVQRLADDLWI